MSPIEFSEWLETATLKELCDSVIWEQVMEGTAWCGWTDRARANLVKNVQSGVHWAIDKKIKKLVDAIKETIHDDDAAVNMKLKTVLDEISGDKDVKKAGDDISRESH